MKGKNLLHYQSLANLFKCTCGQSKEKSSRWSTTVCVISCKQRDRKPFPMDILTKVKYMIIPLHTVPKKTTKMDPKQAQIDLKVTSSNKKSKMKWKILTDQSQCALCENTTTSYCSCVVVVPLVLVPLCTNAEVH